MYGYSDSIPLTANEILKRVSQEEIFSIILKKEPKEYEYIVSPLRDDDNAGCFFARYNGKLLFVDYGDTERTHRDCFNFVQRYYRLTFPETLSLINEKLKIGIGFETSDIVLPEKYVIHDKPIQSKENVRIEFKPRSFSLADKRFWIPYGIHRQQLIDDGVFAVRWYKFYSSRKKRMIIVRPQTISYAYTDFDDGKLKIYTPFPTSRDLKFVSGCGVNDIGGINNLPLSGDKLIITKSYKDYRVLKNERFNVIWLQSEGMFPSSDIITQLGKRFFQIYVIFDNDEVGIKKSLQFVATINSTFPHKAKSVFVPKYENVKDPSDLYKEKGRDELLLFLIKYNLLL